MAARSPAAWCGSRRRPAPPAPGTCRAPHSPSVDATANRRSRRARAESGTIESSWPTIVARRAHDGKLPAMIDVAGWDVARLAAEWRAARPFAHVVVDALLPEPSLQTLCQALAAE